jgi:type VI secretion system protein ImpA
VAEAIAKCKSRVATILTRRGVRVGAAENNGDDAAAGENGQEGAEGHGSNGASTGPIRSREDALARLREVADFFRRTEPHSPVPYLIQRAINWSRMTFDQLLSELVKDENSRHEINSTLGIRAEGGEAAFSSGSGQEEVT